MIISPSESYRKNTNEKISTYQFLAKVACPVLSSVLLEKDERIDEKKVELIKNVLKSNYCTVRYQYVEPSSNPVKGGNKISLTVRELLANKIDGTQMWLLQPVDRTKNLYGINIRVDRLGETITIECVGKGFDVSDINRGNISPHERIIFNYPIEYGWQNEWWKFIRLEMVSSQRFQADTQIRLEKLRKMGVYPSGNIFDSQYKPLPYNIIEKLLYAIQNIDENWNESDEYVVSVSVTDTGKLIFWDIQTSSGKLKIYGMY